MIDSARFPKVALAVIATSAVWLAGSCAHSALHHEERTLNTAHVPASAIQVESVNGSITVKKKDRTDVLIRANLRALTPERLQAIRILAERTGEQTLSVRAEWPGGKRKSQEGCSFEVLVPEAQGVLLRSSNGKLSIAGLAGKGDLETSNGSVEVNNHDGSLMVRTSNGKISVSAVQGTVDVQTSNGSVTVADGASSVKARSSNGAIRIVTAHESPGPIEARTSNGSITLELGEAFAGELELETSLGSLSVAELPGAQLESISKKHARLVVGDADLKSSARTSNGSIRVRSR